MRSGSCIKGGARRIGRTRAGAAAEAGSPARSVQNFAEAHGIEQPKGEGPRRTGAGNLPQPVAPGQERGRRPAARTGYSLDHREAARERCLPGNTIGRCGRRASRRARSAQFREGLSQEQESRPGGTVGSTSRLMQRIQRRLAGAGWPDDGGSGRPLRFERDGLRTGRAMADIPCAGCENGGARGRRSRRARGGLKRNVRVHARLWLRGRRWLLWAAASWQTERARALISPRRPDLL